MAANWQEEITADEESESEDSSSDRFERIRKIKFEAVVDCCAQLFWLVVFFAGIQIVARLIVQGLFTLR